MSEPYSAHRADIPTSNNNRYSAPNRYCKENGTSSFFYENTEYTDQINTGSGTTKLSTKYSHINLIEIQKKMLSCPGNTDFVKKYQQKKKRMQIYNEIVNNYESFPSQRKRLQVDYGLEEFRKKCKEMGCFPLKKQAFLRTIFMQKDAKRIYHNKRQQIKKL